MSHVVSIKGELRDIEAVKTACTILGLQFCENQKRIRWYGGWMNDYSAGDAAYKLGIPTSEYGKSDHAIRVPGSDYDVGLLRNKQTGGYRLYFDFYGSNGQVIQKAIGRNGERLMQHYLACKATMEARKRGRMVQRFTAPNGNIKLVITGLA